MPHQSTIALHVLQLQLIYGRLHCCPEISVFVTQAFFATVHKWILQAPVFLPLQYFLRRKGRHSQNKHGPQRIHRKQWWPLQPILYLCQAFQSIQHANEHVESNIQQPNSSSNEIRSPHTLTAFLLGDCSYFRNLGSYED